MEKQERKRGLMCLSVTMGPSDNVRLVTSDPGDGGGGGHMGHQDNRVLLLRISCGPASSQLSPCWCQDNIFLAPNAMSEDCIHYVYTWCDVCTPLYIEESCLSWPGSHFIISLMVFFHKSLKSLCKPHALRVWVWSCVDIILQNPFFSFQFYSVFSVMV